MNFRSLLRSRKHTVMLCAFAAQSAAFLLFQSATLIESSPAVEHVSGEPRLSQTVVVTDTGTSNSRTNDGIEDGAGVPVSTQESHVVIFDAAISQTSFANSGVGRRSRSSMIDDEHRQLLVGCWEQYSYGLQNLTIREDGTATIVVEPEGVWAFALGKRIRIDIAWELNEGRAVFRVIGGEPEKKTDVVVRMWGRDWNQSILELNQERLLLLGEDGTTRYDWKRVSSSTN